MFLFGLNEIGFVGVGVEVLDIGFLNNDGFKVMFLNFCFDEMLE